MAPARVLINDCANGAENVPALLPGVLACAALLRARGGQVKTIHASGTRQVRNAVCTVRSTAMRRTIARMAAVIIGIAVILLVVIVVARRRRASTDSTEIMKALRERALTEQASELGITVEPGKAWGVVMETGYPGAVASLVTFADGSASLYFSTGGGVIGGGEHASVNQAAKAFVATASTEMQHFQPAASYPPPGEGITTFYVRSAGGLQMASVPESELGAGLHPLSKLFDAGQSVITQLRLISENRQ